MKKIFILIISLMFLLSSCSVDPYIPSKDKSDSSFAEYEGLYRKAVEELINIDEEILVSDTSVFRHDLCKDISGLYMIKFKDGKASSASHITNTAFSSLISSCGVKMIDQVISDGKHICTFGFATANHDFDWGYYYFDEDTPIYIGDPDADLTPSENGYIYERKVSAMTTVTYYTEKLSENFFYYEIK